MDKIKINIHLLVVFCSLIFIQGCSQPDFRILESTKQSGITLETRFSRGFFEKGGDFEFRISNNSGKDIKGLIIILDGKYKHTLNGLYSKEKGIIKSEIFKNGEQYTLNFNKDYSNLVYFEISDIDFVFPKTISVQSELLSDEWKF